ncbi:MAG: hypothetical protein CML67_07010 [Rhodobacteraceae bacterium]|nr:hypothetical protein [Paracoccaceae bacterium]
MEAGRRWRGVFPAVLTNFASDDALDAQEIERCFALRTEAGADGFSVCGSLGKAMTLEPDEEL